MLLVTAISSCEKTLDVSVPSGSYLSATLFEKPEGAQTAMRGIYESMTTSGFSLKTNPLTGIFSGTLGLCSDELIRVSYNDLQQQFFENKVIPENTTSSGIWSSIYNYIFQANQLYELTEQSKGLNQQIKDELMGEAMFIRAMSYFYMTNLYNQVPLALTSDYMTNSLLPVSTQDKIYEQIITDLKFAGEKMSATKFTVAGNRVRASRWAAKAFLAKVYLYRKDWKNAEALATEVLNQTALYKLEPLENVFLATSNEAIWQLANPNSLIYNTEIGLVTGLNAANTVFRLSPYVISLFQAGDQRLTKWTRLGTGTGANTRAPFKFKTFNSTQAGAKKEQCTPIRLAELYLIRAEARAAQDLLSDAIKDLDEIRKRAGAVGDSNPANGNDKILFKTIAFANPTVDRESLISLIYEERLRELFAEQGHRWFDAKRSGKTLSDFFGTRKPGIDESAAYLPIPANEIKFNPNL